MLKFNIPLWSCILFLSEKEYTTYKPTFSNHYCFLVKGGYFPALTKTEVTSEIGHTSPDSRKYGGREELITFPKEVYFCTATIVIDSLKCIDSYLEVLKIVKELKTSRGVDRIYLAVNEMCENIFNLVEKSMQSFAVSIQAKSFTDPTVAAG